MTYYLCLTQDGEMIPYTKELGEAMKHHLQNVGKKYIFSMKDLLPDDAGLYQLDVEDVNVFSTNFKSKFCSGTYGRLTLLLLINLLE